MFVDLRDKKSAIPRDIKHKITDEDLREVFSEIRDQFEDHLTAINENTNEIQANYESYCELDAKIDKLNERLDRMELFLRDKGFKAEEKPSSRKVQNLTKKEQEVFLILYTHEEKGPISYDEIARKLSLTQEIVATYIQNIIAKGVPVHKRYIANKAYVRLDQRFKHIQTKKNVLKISQTIIPNVITDRD